VANDLNPALESERLGQLLTVWFSILQGVSRRQTSWRPRVPRAGGGALDARYPAGRLPGDAGHGTRRPVQGDTDLLSTAPTSTALVARSRSTQTRAVPARAIPGRRVFLQIPGSEAICLRFPLSIWPPPCAGSPSSLLTAMSARMALFKSSNAGVQLIAIAHELGRLHGCDRLW